MLALVSHASPCGGVTLDVEGNDDYQSIYRFSPTQWFAWANDDIDVVPAPIRNDTLRRTYWTGDDFPRMTDTTIMGAFSGPGVPVSRRLGIPAPEDAADGGGDGVR